MDEEFETNLGDDTTTEQDTNNSPGTEEQSNDSPDDVTNSDNTSSDSNDEPIEEPELEPSPEELELEEFKKYARIDYNDDDNLINILLDAAKNYIKRATGKVYDETNKLHVLLKNLLALHFYENRAAVTAISVNEVPFTIKNLLTFLQMTTEDESEEDTSNESETTTEEGE